MSNTNQSNDTLMGVLAYLGILVLVPLFAAKESAFARFHVNQGLLLLIAEVICGVVSVIPFIGFLGWIISVAIAVFAIIGIINATKGEMKPLPLIGNITLIK